MRLSTTIKSEAVALGLYKMTGRRPIIADVAGKARIYWAPQDLPFVREWFENQVMRAGSLPPGDVSVDLVPVVGPYVAKSAVPLVLLTLAVGVLAGRYL